MNKVNFWSESVEPFLPIDPGDVPDSEPDNSKREPIIPPLNPNPRPAIPDFVPDDDEGEEKKNNEKVK